MIDKILPQYVQMLHNKIELLEEDIECVHMFLDGKDILRGEESGAEYSLVGRINLYKKSAVL
jgi:hypothetical protein|tara:strand:- start:3884 stop:4069 length:186 start_codon:yes stop_codon:yes gene_type:complete